MIFFQNNLIVNWWWLKSELFTQCLAQLVLSLKRHWRSTIYVYEAAHNEKQYKWSARPNYQLWSEIAVNKILLYSKSLKTHLRNCLVVAAINKTRQQAILCRWAAEHWIEVKRKLFLPCPVLFVVEAIWLELKKYFSLIVLK